MAKYILESEEIFEAYARIDCAYYLFQKMYEKMGVAKPAIERAIDEATGYAEKEMSEMKQTAIELMEQVIKDKKLVEVDYSKDQKILEELKQLNKGEIE